MTCRNKIDKKSKNVMDQQTDGRTDKAGCRVACTRLKMLGSNVSFKSPN